MWEAFTLSEPVSAEVMTSPQKMAVLALGTNENSRSRVGYGSVVGCGEAQPTIPTFTCASGLTAVDRVHPPESKAQLHAHGAASCGSRCHPPPRAAKSRYGERPDIDRRVLARNEIGNDASRDRARCQADMSMAEGVEDIGRYRGRSDNRTAIRRRGPMPHPALDFQALAWPQRRIGLQRVLDEDLDATPIRLGIDMRELDLACEPQAGSGRRVGHSSIARHDRKSRAGLR